MDATNHARHRTNRQNFQKKQKKQNSSRTSISALKKRRRDLNRLLEHSEKLPADVRIGYERELASCNNELEAAEDKTKRSQMIKKYHMVRFFERKKATRALKKARQNLAEAETPAEKKGLEAEVHNCEVDLNYTQYYPLDVAYVSLYASRKDEEESVNRDDPMWKVVEQEMLQGRLQALREGRLHQEQAESAAERVSADSKQPRLYKKLPKRAADAENSAKSSKKFRRHEQVPDVNQQESDDEDGAGFFE